MDFHFLFLILYFYTFTLILYFSDRFHIQLKFDIEFQVFNPKSVQEHRKKLQDYNKSMLALFIAHGSPMNAIENNELTKLWKKIGQQLGKPRAIPSISAHWCVQSTRITKQKIKKTIHDFGAFPDELHKAEYKSQGSEQIADEIIQLLKGKEEISVAEDEWGLNHGVWCVLTHMYPQPDFPILQLSINTAKSAEWHFQFGNKLAVLREKGILILTSGAIIHNLGMIKWQKPVYGYDWAIEIDKKISSCILSRDFSPVINYQKLSPMALKAIPTPEHQLPLLYTLGIINNQDKIRILNQNYEYGSFSMTSAFVGGDKTQVQ